jgi:hypothetical protein
VARERRVWVRQVVRRSVPFRSCGFQKPSGGRPAEDLMDYLEVLRQLHDRLKQVAAHPPSHGLPHSVARVVDDDDIEGGVGVSLQHLEEPVV